MSIIRLVISIILLEVSIAASTQPNIVILLADDLGIGDIGCYENRTILTPHIDSLAKDGVLLHHHLSVAPMCTPSRAALLTGRYPAKFGLEPSEDEPRVIVHVASEVGLPESETTIAEVLSSVGYRTGLVGKWHLGSGCGWFGSNCLGPLGHGFDHFYGLLLTLLRAMNGHHSFFVFDLRETNIQIAFFTYVMFIVTVVFAFTRNILRSLNFFFFLILGTFIFGITWFIFTHYRLHTDKWWQVSPWMDENFDGVITENGKLIHSKPNFDSMFSDFVSQSQQFIRNSSRDSVPFFLFHSFAHVHTPMFCSSDRCGKSSHGRYGDNIEEMDTGVGQILETLKDLQLERNTIVYFASDHGGHLESISPVDGHRNGGHNGNFKGGKGMGGAEGGIRVPGLIRWPDRLLPGLNITTPTSQLDILPTLLDLIQATAEIKNLDGLSFAPILSDPKSSLPDRYLLHHCGQEIHALRFVTKTKIYKMYNFVHRWQPGSTQCGWGPDVYCTCGGNGVTNVTDSPILFELKTDPYENNPINSETIEDCSSLLQFYPLKECPVEVHQVLVGPPLFCLSELFCTCGRNDVVNVTDSPILYELDTDLYENKPNNLSEYREVVQNMKSFLVNWRNLNPYPPSLYSSKLSTVLAPWRQPNVLSEYFNW